jgi:NDP-sugar pyrophosphorylase family protein
MNGDLVTAVNLGRMLAFHRAGRYAATIALRDHVVKVPFGVVETVADGSTTRITALKEKPILSYAINAGIYVLDPQVLSRIPNDRAYPITELFNDCLNRGESLGGYHLDEVWNDLGLPEEYLQAKPALPGSGHP